jgi:hypothetical protein
MVSGNDFALIQLLANMFCGPPNCLDGGTSIITQQFQEQVSHEEQGAVTESRFIPAFVVHA